MLALEKGCNRVFFGGYQTKINGHHIELAAQLEAPFLPAWFHCLDRRPQNANDKVDIAGLLTAHAAKNWPLSFTLA
ncbi:MAG: hypothetical protein AB7G62_08315 [Magnetospirillum sp.]